MKKGFILILVLLLLAIPVSAVETETIPIPDGAQDFLPSERGNFLEDLQYIVKSALMAARPDIAEGISLSVSICAVGLLLCILQSFDSANKRILTLSGVVIISCLVLQSVNGMIHLGGQTITDISAYGKLLLPIMATALASMGGGTTSAALYAATALFDSILSTLIASVLLPMVYIYLALSVVHAATRQQLLRQLRDGLKTTVSWCLKTTLYVFIAYISITGVVSGATDQMAMKAAKLTISGAVPVVGGILSDASEAVLVSMGLARNAAGIYGILAVIALLAGPFLKIGIQYLLLKLVSVFTGVCGDKVCEELIGCFSLAMGFLLAMTGSVCLMQLISLICFMKGVQV